MFKQIFELFKADSLYEQALVECYEMLEIDREMFNESVKSLRASDTADIPIDIYAMDKKINEFERDVRRKVMTHLAVSGNEDLGSGLILVSVVVDIERIGDYTKNILDLAIFNPKPILAEEVSDSLGLIEEVVLSRFSSTISALENRDPEKAQVLLKSYRKDLGRVSDGIVHNIISGDFEIKNNVSPASVVLYARYLKRIGAHLKNITSVVTNPFEMIGYNS